MTKSAQRRASETAFLNVLIATGQTLRKHADTPEKKYAAARVLRRLRILLHLPRND